MKVEGDLAAAFKRLGLVSNVSLPLILDFHLFSNSYS